MRVWKDHWLYIIVWGQTLPDLLDMKVHELINSRINNWFELSVNWGIDGTSRCCGHFMCALAKELVTSRVCIVLFKYDYKSYMGSFVIPCARGSQCMKL